MFQRVQDNGDIAIICLDISTNKMLTIILFDPHSIHSWSGMPTIFCRSFLIISASSNFFFLQVENLFLIELPNRNPKKFVYLKQNKHKQKQLSHNNSTPALESTSGKHQFNVQLE